MARRKGFTWEPLPADVFDYVNGFVAVVEWTGERLGHYSVICRDKDSGLVTKGQPSGLDLRFRMRGVLVRWLRDERRRELRRPWVRGTFFLSDQEWSERV